MSDDEADWRNISSLSVGSAVCLLDRDDDVVMFHWSTWVNKEIYVSDIFTLFSSNK